MVRTVAILNSGMVQESDTVKCNRTTRGKSYTPMYRKNTGEIQVNSSHIKNKKLGYWLHDHFTLIYTTQKT